MWIAYKNGKLYAENIFYGLCIQEKIHSSWKKCSMKCANGNVFVLYIYFYGYYILSQPQKYWIIFFHIVDGKQPKKNAKHWRPYTNTTSIFRTHLLILYFLFFIFASLLLLLIHEKRNWLFIVIQTQYHVCIFHLTQTIFLKRIATWTLIIPTNKSSTEFSYFHE